MTKKDFIALADSLRLLKADLAKASADGCDNAIDLAFDAHMVRVMNHCAKRNENTFSYPRFEAAVNGTA